MVMFKKICLIILFLFVSVSSLSAEIIKKIIIEGNKRISEETIKVYGDININQDYSENDINKVLNSLYSTNFFKKINISLNKNILKIDLEEYPIVNQLILVGEKNNSYEKEIKKIMRLKEKQSFIKSLLADDVELIKRLYSTLGYNFAKVDAKTRKIDDTSLDLLISITRGEKTKISSLNNRK